MENTAELSSVSYRLRRSFDDFDQFAEDAGGWDLEFQQLDSGQFHGDMHQLDTERALLGYAHFNRRLEQRGAPPQGYLTFVITAFPRIVYRWRGHTVTDRDLAVFPMGGELAALSPACWAVFTFSVMPEVINAEAEIVGVPPLLDLTRGAEVVRLSSAILAALRETFHSLISGGLKEGEGLGNHECKILEEEVPRLLLSGLASDSPLKHLPRLRLRDRAMKRAEEFIHEFADEPLAVSQICRVAGVSERTLDYSFREKFQTSPKAYLKVVRLNGARRNLRDADPDLSTVIDIAGQWGFWHMGQFAADYRRHFDELPSETLRRPALG